MSDLERVRTICMGLGNVEERLSHGAPSWFYKGKRCFCMFMDHHHGVDWVALWVACPAGVAAGLVASDSGRFFVPPYVGTRGWVGVRLDTGADWGEVKGLLEGAWGLVKAKK